MAPRTRAERQAELVAQQQEPEPRKQTATERVAEIEALAFANNGLLIPSPVPITYASAHKWLSDIAEIGNAGHVEIAWQYGVRGGGKEEDGSIKTRLYNEYMRLASEAGKRYGVLLEQAAAEEAAERAAHQERMKTVTKQREKAGLMARLAALEAQD